MSFSGRSFARSSDGASGTDASRLSGATAPPHRRWHPRQRAHKWRGAPASGEPEPRWARRPWRAERLAASSIVPPVARAFSRRGTSASDGAYRGRRACVGNVHLHGPAGAAVGAVRHRHGRPAPGRDDLPAARRDRPSGRLAVAALVSPLGIVSSSLCTRVSSPNGAGGSCGLVAPGPPIGAVSPTSPFGPCGRAEPAGPVSPVAPVPHCPPSGPAGPAAAGISRAGR